MNFVIKTYSVPVIINNGKASYQEVKLDKSNEVNAEGIEVKYSVDIPPKANEIQRFNNAQLNMAELDNTIKLVKKKVLCKPESR